MCIENVEKIFSKRLIFFKIKYLKFKQFIFFIANIGKILIFHEYINCLENEKGNILNMNFQT